MTIVAARRTIAAAVLVLLTSCAGEDTTSSDDSKKPDPTAKVTIKETITATPADQTDASDSATPGAGGNIPLIEGPLLNLRQVRSPTGNIWCSLEYGVECMVRENDYEPLPRPPDCSLDWTDHEFALGDTGLPIRGACRGDTSYSSEPPVLPYGRTTLVENRACQSTEMAMMCWSTQSGHGFWLSRAGYNLF